jgi:SAM-dependent methyltransferase
MFLNLRRLGQGEIGFRAAALGIWGSICRRLGLREFGRAYFAHVYRHDDPWNYESSPYEKRKYAALLSGLRPSPYDHILEIGCSIGVFTEMLARTGKQVTAVDISARAAALASRRCRHLSQVHIRRIDFLSLQEKGSYDLIIAAEILYFFWRPLRVRSAVRDKLAALLADGGTLVLVWGGFRLEQDWDAFLQEDGRLLLLGTKLHEDPERPFRISFFKRVAARIPAAPRGV